MGGNSDSSGEMVAEHIAIKTFRQAKAHAIKHHKAYWKNLVDPRAAWWYVTVVMLCALFTTSPVPDKARSFADGFFGVMSMAYLMTVVFTAGETSRRGTTWQDALRDAFIVFLCFGLGGLVMVVFTVWHWYVPTDNDGSYLFWSIGFGFINIIECFRRGLYPRPKVKAAAPVATVAASASGAAPATAVPAAAE